MTHNELVELTANKIQAIFGCGLIMKEMTTSSINMTPDVFAVKKGGVTFQFEIKVSLCDFLKDKKKPHRKQPEFDVGMYRYYVLPKGIITPEHNDIVNNPANWGIIEVSKGGQFSFLRGLNPRSCGKSFFSTTKNDFYNKSNSVVEMELVYSYYQSMIFNSQENGIKVNAICERLTSDAEELINVVKRIRN